MTIELKKLAHIGIRVSDLERSLAFYQHFGFEPVYEAPNDAVVLLTDSNGLEINFIINADPSSEPHNILMDGDTKHPGYTHVALEISSYQDLMDYCAAHGIDVTSEPVDLGNGVS